MLTPERRRSALHAARWFACGAFGLEALAIALLFLDERAVVLGTLACAALAMIGFYAAFEGFDEVLRRPK